MTGCARTVLALMAAGRSARFGGNKLEADAGGKMLGLHVADALADLGFARRLAVCATGTEALNAALLRRGWDIRINTNPERGLSGSIILAAEAADAGDALLICLADMPGVDADHVQALLERFEQAGRDQIISSSNGKTHMPPAVFPRRFWAQISALTGDTGARALLQDTIAVPADARLLADIDTQADLAAFRPGC
jgi:molybdenum cofactor cytidylyltransferase